MSLSVAGLLTKECAAKPMTICITGGTGYVAGPVIKRLLSAGHVVHTTVRDPNRAALIEPLKKLPGAADRLKIFKADLLQAGSFDEAVQGCQSVIHIASPLIGNVKPAEVDAKLLKPAIDGTKNVLSSVEKAPTVSKVVLTSSMASVIADMKEHGDKVLDENTWSIKTSPSLVPYYYSKREAEKAAWEMCRAQSRWKLATIHPGLVIGAPLSKREDSESIKYFADALNGKFYPALASFGIGCSTIDDVAAAHCAAAVIPEAEGRYLIAKSYFFRDIFYLFLKDDYPKNWLPSKVAPLWLIRILGPFVGLARDQIETSYCTKLPEVDVSKAERELGLKLGSVKQAALDMCAKLVEFGIAKKL